MEKNEIKEMLLRFKEHKAGKEEILKQMSGQVHISSGSQKKTEMKQSVTRPGANDSDIAIIGMSCRFPNARDLDQYWYMIRNGVNAIKEVPGNRFDINKIYGDPFKEKNKTNCRWGGFLDQIDAFDPLFFQISPKEAELMDPQQRLFLMEAWKTFEHAGYSAQSLEKKKCGVFAGYADGDYKVRLMEDHVPKDASYFMGNSGAILSARISYLLNLKGPSISLDTACSSSLVALHLACESIRSGECQMALAGGVSAFLSPELYLLAGSAGMLSADGQCKAFDNSANGFVPAEGVGCVLVKSLKHAVEDNDKIYAVIKGSGINQDGKSNGITAPNALSQTALEQEVYDKYQINPEEIGYIEAHGTGTILGDPIEVTALIESFKKYTDKENFCGLGSVKTNIGHAQLAAGAASIIKAVLMLQNKEIPPIVNFKEQNCHIDMNHTPFYINTENKIWTCEKEGTRKIAVSGFGFSGTNAHIVLEEYNEEFHIKEDGSKHYYPICISAKSETSLQKELQELRRWVKRNENELSIERISYSLYQYKSHFHLRTAFVVSSTEELLEMLAKFEDCPEMVEMKDTKSRNRISGNGKQGQSITIQKILRELNQEQLTLEEEKEKMDYLAESYKAGYLFDAIQLYPSCSYPRMAMPEYQFDMERCWYKAPEEAKEQYQTPAASSFDSYEYEVILEEQAFYIRDHIIEGKKILPGVAYVEFARAAVRAATGKDMDEIGQIIWQSPVTVKEGSRSLFVQLKPAGDKIKFQIVSKDGASAEVHCQGTVCFMKDQETEKKALNIAGIKAGLLNKRGQNQHYNYFEQRGMNHGNSMRAVRHLYTGKNRALAYIELPEEIRETRGDFVLHPAVLDGALQTVIGVESAVVSDHNVIFLPFAIQKVKLYEALPDKLYSYAVKAAEQEFTIWLADSTGKLVGKIEGLRMRSVYKEQETTHTYLVSDWFLSDFEEKKTEQKAIFLIDAKRQECTEISFDSTEIKTALWRDGKQERDFSLEQYDSVVYLAEPAENEADCLEQGVYQFFTLLKTKLILRKRPVYLLYLYDRTSPYAKIYEAVDSLCKSAMLENSNLIVTTFGYETAVSYDMMRKELGQKQKNTIRYVNGSRYALKVEKIELQKYYEEALWEKNGVYVLTGGNGKLGRQIAEYLISEYQAKVILLGRNIEDSYGKEDSIESYAVDICEKERLCEVCGKIMDRYGKITGVLHCAGIHKDALLCNKTLEEFKEVIRPKVLGTECLMECMQASGAEYYVFFSSTTAISGTPGQSDYAYANAYLNAYAKGYREADKKVISICWPFWENGGMQISGQDKQFMKETVGMEGITVKEGLDMLTVCLKSGKKNIIPFKGDVNKFLLYLTKTSAVPQIAYTYEIDNGGKKVNLNLYGKGKELVYSQIEKLINISQDKIKEDHDFTDYGFDSILLTSLANELNEILHADLMPTIFFDKSCIRDFIQYLCDEYLVKQMEKTDKAERVNTIETDVVWEAAASEEEMSQTIEFVDAVIQTEPETQEPGCATEAKPCCQAEDAVAIIGMAGVMPQSNSLEEFFSKLEAETDFVTEIPKDRWDYRKSGKEDMRWGAFMQDIDTFDTEFFSISPREAELMDPQQRILLECVWHTIENAGYKASELRGSNTGVFVGVSTMDYTDLSKKANVAVSGYTSTGRAHSVLVNRVSYLYDFHGPSEPVDTACSSSLIAIIRGVKSIQDGDCDTVIAGGVNVIASDDLYVAFSKSGMLAKDGKCKTFDKDADGYVRGEGVGTVFLKSLSKAKQDGDHIYAIVKGCGISHGGHASSLTAPNAAAQADLIVNTYTKAGISPLDISYIEAHGTGTKLGDPVEIDGLKKAFKRLCEQKHITNWEEGYCSVGSVKSNIGHLEAAAGIASVFKVLFALQKHRLPASIHIHELNPYLALKGSPFRVVQKTKDWTIPDGKKRMAGISCFGYGGANAHLVLEEYDDKRLKITGRSGNNVFLYSAQNEKQLRVYIEKHIQYLEKKKANDQFCLESYAYVLQTGREGMEERLAVLAENAEQLLSILKDYREEKGKDAYYTGNTETQNSMFRILKESASWSEYEKKIYADKDYNAIAVLWINGADLDFQKLYADRKPDKIVIPDYPFEKTRYWLPVNNTAFGDIGKHALHPLIDENVSSMDKVVFKKTLSKEEFFIRDHNIQGKTILPGVAYLEMVRAAGELAQQSKISMIEDVIWAAPIEVSDTNKDSFVEFVKVNEKINYKVYCKEFGQDMVASQGKISSILQPEDCSSISYSITDLKSRLPKMIYREDAYLYFAKLGFRYGDTFKCIESIQSSQTEALGRYRVSRNKAVQADGFKLMIPAMDAALQTIMGTGSSSPDGEEKQFIPFALKRLVIFDKVPESGYAYIRLHSQSEDGNVRKFNISILDEAGKEKVRFEEFTSRALEASSGSDQKQIKALYYRNQWKEMTGNLTAFSESGAKLIILLGNETQREKYQREFNKYGIQNILFIQDGYKYQKLDSSTFMIRAGEYEDYEKALRGVEFATYDEIIVYHTFATDEILMNTLSVQERLEYGYLSISYLVKVLLRINVQGFVKIGYVYAKNQDIIQPENEMVSGMCKSLQYLNHKYAVTVIAADFTGKEEEMTAKIVLEMLSKEAYEPKQIWFNGKGRFQNTIDKASLAEQDSLSCFQEGDNVLITGGFGKLGKMFAAYLAEQNVNVVLLGRREEAAEAEWMDKIRRAGADISYIQCDITVHEEVHRAYKICKENGKTITGILHIAGLAGDHKIDCVSLKEYQKPLTAKLFGTANLDTVFRKEPLKSVVYFSSAASQLGDYGACSYACANAYLNAYAQVRNKLVRKHYLSGNTYSIQWGIWADGAMKLPVGDEEQYFNTTGMVPIPKELGIKMFRNIVAQEECSLIGVTGNEARLDRLLELAKMESKPNLQNHAVHEVQPEKQKNLIKKKVIKKQMAKRPMKKTEGAIDLKKKTADYFRTVIANAVKTEEKNVGDMTTFEKLGIESFMIMDIHEVLEQNFENLSRTLFFEYHNLMELVGYFLEEHEEELIKMFQNDRGQEQEGQEEYEEVEIEVEEEIEIEEEREEKAEDSDTVSRVNRENKNLDIAIIGISGRYPMAQDIEELYENLKAGKDCIEEIPLERFDYRTFYDEKGGNGKITCKWGGFIKDADKFDEEFFGIVPKVASMMDPQERIMLEAAWQAIEDSGYTPDELTASANNTRSNDVGVFVGMMYDDYKIIETQELVNHNYDSLTEYWNSPIANRISFMFDFRGPSYVVDSACSSSLTTIHMACDSIRSGQCNYAVAGGVSLSLHPSKYLRLTSFGMSSPTGRCKSFGEGADGYVPGEGVGAVLLKPLAQAESDGDNIYAVIKGSSVNHGGRANGFTVPNPNAQSDVIVNALEKCGMDARSISYIETHGTGTALGDPIEIRGLTKAFHTKEKQFCKIGSIKSNIGHCEGAAGIAAVTKVALQLKNKQLFPSLHAEVENQLIDFKNSPFVIQKTLGDWKQPCMEVNGSLVDIPRRAGISSFGAGGSNAHVIMEEYIHDEGIEAAKKDRELIFISAKDKEAFDILLHDWVAYLDKTQEELHNIAYTSIAGRLGRRYRLAVTAMSKEDAKQQILAYMQSNRETVSLYYGIVKQEREDADIVSRHENDMKNRSLETLAELWTRGFVLSYRNLFDGDKNFRVSIPKHPLKKNRHWIRITYDVNAISSDRDFSQPTETGPTVQEKKAGQSEAVRDKSEKNQAENTGKEDMKSVVAEYLCQILADITQIQKDKIDTDTEFSEYGIDSIGITSFGSKVLEDFPGVSETALFAYQTIHDLADYLCESYEDEVNEFFCSTLSVKKETQGAEESSSLDQRKEEFCDSEPLGKKVETQDIAIIGISAKMPGCENLDEYWDNLCSGKNSGRKINRWDMSQYYDEEVGKIGKTYCQYGSFLENIDVFDPQFFHIAKAEADAIDPQERMFLQEAWNAVVNAGYTRESIDRNTGVFVGVTTSSYRYVGYEESLKGTPAHTSTSFSSIANRVSYTLDLRGPSIPVDSMCSSTIAAIHMACQEIKAGHCNMAIAGGVNLYSHPMAMVNLSRLKLLSRDDKTRSFCEGGTGFVPAEAVGAVILKSLEEAKKDGDFIYAIIRGSAAGHIGRSNAYFTQNPIRQAEVIERAIEDAGVPKKSISYIETATTGTEVNDAVEIESLINVFKKEGIQEHSIAIGSVKPNIGHAESASGIGQLMKVLLQLQHKKIAPTKLCGTINRKIALDHSQFYLADHEEAWGLRQGENEVYPRRAAINSIGAGGYIAHIILEEAEQRAQEQAANDDSTGTICFPVSSNTKRGLIRNMKKLLEFCRKNQGVSSHAIAYNLQVNRQHYRYRAVVLGENREILCGKLEQFCGGNYCGTDVYCNFLTDEECPLDRNDPCGALAYEWVNGMNVNWQEAGEKPAGKVPLPGYSFEEVHCWYEEEKDISVFQTALTAANAKLSPFWSGMILKYLKDEGIFEEPESFNQQLEKLSDTERKPAVNGLLEIVMNHQLLVKKQEGMVLSDSCKDEVIQTMLSYPEKRAEFLTRAFPELGGHLKFLLSISGSLASILHGRLSIEAFIKEEQSIYPVIKNETRFDQMLLFYHQKALNELLSDRVGTVTILDDHTFTVNAACCLIGLCRQHGLEVVYNLYEEISSVAAVKKAILTEQGITVVKVPKERRGELLEEADFILTGRIELSSDKGKKDAICIRYIPALTEYFLIVYRMMEKALDMKAYLTMETDKLLTIRPVQELKKTDYGSIEEHVILCLSKELGVSKTDIDNQADLAELGMNSILMARLYTQLVEKYGNIIEPVDILEAKNTDQLIQVIEGKNKKEPAGEEKNAVSVTTIKNDSNIFTTISGRTYEYFFEGEGEPLLVLTALAFTPEVWRYQKEQWKHKYKMIFPTLPGHGNSKLNGSQIRFNDIVEDIKELLDYLKVDSVNMLGWCMAGNILQKFVQIYPERVKKVCFICTTPEDASVRGVSSNDLKEYSENPLGTYELEFMNIYNSDESKRNMIREFVGLINESHCHVDSIALFCYINELFKFKMDEEVGESLTMPVLIIAGRWDITYPADQVEKLKEVFKNAVFQIFEQSGHMPFISESDKFNACIERFLQGEE